MTDILFQAAEGAGEAAQTGLAELLGRCRPPFAPGAEVGIKVPWGERDNVSFLPATLTREVVRWVAAHGGRPFVFDTTVLYSGGRRDGRTSLETAREHGFSPAVLGCPVLIGDGLDGRDVIDLAAGYRHFATVQVAGLLERTDAFVIFSHFKGHLAAGFGGAIKNLSMGLASRAQKQRLHADARPHLLPARCTRCGTCVAVCPTGAAGFAAPGRLPAFDLGLCSGCAQCIAQCPELALRLQWRIAASDFQERVVETAAAVWRRIAGRTLLVNALLQITAECDCMAGDNPRIAPDVGFLAGEHPLPLDEASLARVGAEPFDRAHPGLPWPRQLLYAREIGFAPHQETA